MRGWEWLGRGANLYTAGQMAWAALGGTAVIGALWAAFEWFSDMPGPLLLAAAAITVLAVVCLAAVMLSIAMRWSAWRAPGRSGPAATLTAAAPMRRSDVEIVFDPARHQIDEAGKSRRCMVGVHNPGPSEESEVLVLLSSVEILSNHSTDRPSIGADRRLVPRFGDPAWSYTIGPNDTLEFIVVNDAAEGAAAQYPYWARFSNMSGALGVAYITNVAWVPGRYRLRIRVQSAVSAFPRRDETFLLLVRERAVEFMIEPDRSGGAL